MAGMNPNLGALGNMQGSSNGIQQTNAPYISIMDFMDMLPDGYDLTEPNIESAIRDLVTDQGMRNSLFMQLKELSKNITE